MVREKQNQFLIGTCGYSYPGEPPAGWYGVFYPKTLRKGTNELGFYASFFDAVEINSTFYRPPSPAMADAWVKKTPENFKFAVKAWQKFTHPMKIGGGAGGAKKPWERSDDQDVVLFQTGIAPLADAGKFGVLLFQYPPSFHYTPDSVERLEAILAAFADYPKAVELRHRSWSDHSEETKRLLGRSLAAWAYIDEPKFASSLKQTITIENAVSYLRLHGRNYHKWWKHREAWERYDYFYDADQIRGLGEKIRLLAAQSPETKIYLFFNNHARAQAVANALMLKAELTRTIPEPLPQSLLEAFPALKNLVKERGAESSKNPQLRSG